jgi:DNA-directed RNA polymerase specialized sigma24 family protein
VIFMAADQANRTMTMEEKQALLMYMDQNKTLFNNSVIQGFFTDPEHVRLLAQHLLCPSPENSNQLEAAFRRYFFRIRFTKYLCSLIRFCNIDYHRKRTREEQRSRLVFDSAIDDSGEATLGELLYSDSKAIEDEMPVWDPASFQQSFADEALFFAFNRLTAKQKLVITLAYSSCALDTEIAALLRISQQAITKTRLSAIRKLRPYVAASPHPSGARKQREGASQDG